ncbi:hypothetical protein SLS55_008951 [Diplodia seriata]|uniref:Protein YIM1-1 n=1 Tax=Diplodia seriata TaxID=420778 RepID=A0A1S8BGE7_9PEZI|nr:Protein YIM1-1 [Diplodia seriata]
MTATTTSDPSPFPPSSSPADANHDDNDEEEPDLDPDQPTIKAWVYTPGLGYPACVKQTLLPAPISPSTTTGGGLVAPTHLLVRVRAAALNPVDIQLMNFLPSFLPERGFGADFAGTVIAAGRDSGFADGDDVFGVCLAPFGGRDAGTVREVLSVDVTRAVVARKPAAWKSWARAAAVPLAWVTARTCVARCEGYVSSVGDDGEEDEGQRGEGGGGTVAVLGASSATGMWAVVLAKRRGWRVVATCGGRNAGFVRSAAVGADVVVDYTQEGGVRAKVAAERPDAIIDCVGGTECLGLARRYVTIVGDKTSRGALGGALTYLWNPQMVLRTLLGKVGLRSEVYECINLEMKTSYLEEALDLDEDKIVLDSTFSFDQVREALERLNSGRCRGKVVVEVGP